MGFLAEDTDHGTRELREIMKGVSFCLAIGSKVHMAVAGHRSDQVFLPVLENAVKAQKLRSTLGVFEKSKFLFNLPGQLMESINAVRVVSAALMVPTDLQGKYDQALRDYKKGTFLNSSKSGQLLPGLAANTPEQREAQKRIFDKVWSSVERIMGDMRTKLDSDLRDPSRTVEEQEKTIEILIELAGDDEPAWVYLDSQHAHIVDSMKGIYNKAQEKCRGEREDLSVRTGC